MMRRKLEYFRSLEIVTAMEDEKLPRNKRTFNAIYNRWSSVPEADISDTASAFAEDYRHMMSVWEHKSN